MKSGTSAGVRDFRGSNGLHTTGGAVLSVGLGEGMMDLTMPTYSHLAVTQLYRMGIVKSVVTSNHDGLHVKSGSLFYKWSINISI